MQRNEIGGCGHPPSIVGGSFRLPLALLSKSNPWRDGAPTVHGCLSSSGTFTNQFSNRRSSQVCVLHSRNGPAASAGPTFNCIVPAAYGFEPPRSRFNNSNALSLTPPFSSASAASFSFSSVVSGLPSVPETFSGSVHAA